MMKLRTSAGSWPLSVWVLGLAACGQAGSDVPAAVPTADDPAQASSDSPKVSDELPFDLGDIVEQARLSFHDDRRGGYVTRQDTHTITARDGALEFTPVSYSASAGKVLKGIPARIETVAIARDEGDYSLGLGTTAPDYQASVVIDRGIATERVYNSPDGIEQTWTFEQEPLGSGALEVRVALTGPRYVGVDERGHHFIDEATQVGVVYSHAAWVDLTGRRTEIPVTFDGEHGELVMAVPATVLADSHYPAVLDPTVGAEFGTTAPAITSSALVEETPAVAFDGTNYLVVWADNRDTESYDIWATFVSTAQVVQNNTGLLISGATGDQKAPSIAFNGTNYLVVWEDYRRTAATQTIDIYAQRVSTAGALVGGELVLSGTGQAGHPDVARLGTSWMVVWEDFKAGTNSNVVFGSVAADGTIGDPAAFNDNPSNEVRPAVACTNTQCMAVFSAGALNGEDIYRQRFDANGLVDTVSATISGELMGRSLLPDLATDGTNYLVVWQDRRSSNNWDLYGNLVSAATGAPSVEAGFIVAGRQTDDAQSPTVVWDGTQYLVAWQDSRTLANGFDIYATRVQANGTVVSANGFPVSAALLGQRVPRAVVGGGQFFLVWEDDRLGPPSNIRGTRVTSTGVVVNTFGTPIATTANRQTSAAIANGGAVSNNNYLLVYNDTRLNGADNYDLVAIRVSQTGVNLDPSGRLITVGGGTGTTGNQIGPEISFNGTNFLVVWQDGRLGTNNYNIYGSIVTVNNTVIFTFTQPDGFPISTAANNQLAPTVAWNAGANSWLVAWGDQRTNTNTDIYAARVQPNGTVTDANGFAISTAADIQQRPAVASDGTNWLVAWTDRSTGVANSENVLGSIVSAAGAPGAIFSVSTAANRQEGVRLTFVNGLYVAVWQDNRLSTTNYNVLGARISTAGAVQDANGVALANSLTLAESRPRLTTMGNNIFVVWSQSVVAGAVQTDLYGRQFTSALAPVAASFAISTQPGSEAQATVAADATNNSAIVAYQRYDASAGVRAERVRYRRVTFP